MALLDQNHGHEADTALIVEGAEVRTENTHALDTKLAQTGNDMRALMFHNPAQPHDIYLGGTAESMPLRAGKNGKPKYERIGE